MDFVDNFSVDKPHIYNVYVNFSAMKSAEKFWQSAEICDFLNFGCTKLYVNCRF